MYVKIIDEMAHKFPKVKTVIYGKKLAGEMKDHLFTLKLWEIIFNYNKILLSIIKFFKILI